MANSKIPHSDWLEEGWPVVCWVRTEALLAESLLLLYFPCDNGLSPHSCVSNSLTVSQVTPTVLNYTN